MVRVAVGSFFRLLIHTVSGVAFFGAYAPEGSSVWAYSFSYNAWYLVPSAIITGIVILMLGRPGEVFEPR